MEQLDYHLLYRQNKWAGNLDLKVLGVGSTLYIPVFNEGALFFTGDPHGVQGDGEVDGGALEQSLTGTLQFILHKGAGKAMRWPRVEDATNYYTLGLDVDLNLAMKEAMRESVELLEEGRRNGSGGLCDRRHGRRLPRGGSGGFRCC